MSSAVIIPVHPNYFANQPGFLSEWEFDHAKFIEEQLRFGCLKAFFQGWDIISCLLPFSCCCLEQCFGFWPILRVADFFMRSKPNAIDHVNAIHVGLTDAGVFYIVEKHKRRHVCTTEDIEKASYFTSYEEIIDVVIKPPTGECCGLIPGLLNRVIVTAVNKRPWDLAGLKQPEAFRNEVLRIKALRAGAVMMVQPQQQQQQQQMVYTQQPGAPQMMMQQQAGQPPQQLVYAQQPGQQSMMMYTQQPGASGQPMQVMYVQPGSQPAVTNNAGQSSAAEPTK